MKSFDEMADDFVATEIAHALPYVLTDSERRLLRIGYLTGYSAAIQFCASHCASSVEEKGL